MPIDQVDRVTFPVSEDNTNIVRVALKGAEDELNRIVADINSKAIFPDAASGAIAAPGDISSTGDVTSGGRVTSTDDIVSGGRVTSTDDIISGAAISSVGGVTAGGSLAAYTGTAIPAGGAAGTGILVSSTPNFGLFFGSGAPAISAAKGALYMRSDGTTTNDRMYVNTDGATTWTAVNTVT